MHETNLMNNIFAKRDFSDWQRLAAKESGVDDPISQLGYASACGIRLKPLYTASDLTVPPPRLDPFIEGWSPRRSRLLVSGYSSGDANLLLKTMQAHAPCGFELVIDNGAGQRSDKGFFANGLAIAAKSDLEQVLTGINLSDCEFALHAGSRIEEITTWLAELLDERKVAKANRLISCNYDFVGELFTHGQLPWSLQEANDTGSRLIAFAQKQFPKGRVITIGAQRFCEAGAPLADGLGYGLASLLYWLRTLNDQGCNLASIIPHIEFRLPIAPQFFASIACLRAARLTLIKLLEECGAYTSGQLPALVGAPLVSAWSNIDPHVNLLRHTTACFAAMAGGVERFVCVPYNARLAQKSIDDDFLPERMAINTTLIGDQEAYLGEVADPASGSWYLESLTQEVAKRAWQAMRRIEGYGGIASAIESGQLQDELSPHREQLSSQISLRQKSLTGVNDFPDLSQTAVQDFISLPQDSPVGHTAQNSVQNGQALTCKSSPPLIWSEEYENLRQSAWLYQKRTHSPPQVALVSWGGLSTYVQRQNFCKNLLAAGGIHSVDIAADRLPENLPKIAVLCAADQQYLSMDLVRLASKLFEKGVIHLGIAGSDRLLAQLDDSPKFDFSLSLGCDAVKLLADLQKRLGVLENE